MAAATSHRHLVAGVASLLKRIRKLFRVTAQLIKLRFRLLTVDFDRNGRRIIVYSHILVVFLIKNMATRLSSKRQIAILQLLLLLLQDSLINQHQRIRSTLLRTMMSPELSVT